MSPKKDTVAKATKPDLESEWKFGPVSGPLCASVGAAIAALAEPLANYPHWAPVAVTGFSAVTTAIIDRLRRKPLALTAYRAGSWVAAGAWTTWVASTGWSWAATVLLGAGAVSAGLLAGPVREIDELAEIRAGLLPASGSPTRRPLTKRELAVKDAIDGLLNLPHPGAEIVSLEDWETGAGYTVRLIMPAETGFGDEEVGGVTIRLARRLRLPPGCLPEAEEGDVQGEVILRVPTLDDLTVTIDYPADYSRMSIYDEHPLGIFGDQSVVLDEMRESSKLLGGRKGGGKTNLMDVYGANLSRCDDVLIWDIDLNGGGMSAFWMLPFALGEVERPPIDWVASNAAEALLMSEIALAIAKARKAQFAGRRAAANSRLLPLDQDLPAIILRVDEGAEVLGDNCPISRLRENVKELHRIGREIGENFVISTLRPTGDMIPIEIRKNSSTRIATRVEEDAELGYMFPQAGVKLRSRGLKSKGEAYFARGDADAPDGTVRRMKIFNLSPARIREIVLATNHLRPYLDPFSLSVADARFELAGEELAFTYSTRWDRLRPYLDRLAENGSAPEEYRFPFAGDVDPAPAAVEDEPRPAASLGEALERYREIRERATAARDAAAEEEPGIREIQRLLDADEDMIRTAFEALTARIASKPIDPSPVNPGPSPAAVTLAARAELVARLVTEAGGLKRAELIEKLAELGVDVTDQTVSDWLRAARDRGLVEPGSKKGQWVPSTGGGTQ